MQDINLDQNNLAEVLQSLRNGDVIAYPTEAVFGLGCDPDNIDALQKLLELKQRPMEKGLILLAADYQQLKPYVDESQLTKEQLERVLTSWPDAITWVFPANKQLSPYLTGQFDSIAVRVTAHPAAKMLCEHYGKPITSTSANLSGHEPCRTSEQVSQQFIAHNIAILRAEIGNRRAPSQIRDARTNTIIREG